MPAQPVFEALELRIAGSRAVVTEGTSPLTLEATDIVPHDFFDAAFVMLQATNPGVVYEQAATITVEMQYEGAQTLGVGAATCSFS